MRLDETVDPRCSIPIPSPRLQTARYEADDSVYLLLVEGPRTRSTEWGMACPAPWQPRRVLFKPTVKQRYRAAGILYLANGRRFLPGFRTRSHLKLNIEGERRILSRAMISTESLPIQEKAFLARNCALAAPL